MFNTKKKLLIQIWRNAARKFITPERNIIKMASRRPFNPVFLFRYGKGRSFTISGMWISTVIMVHCVRYSYMGTVEYWCSSQLRQTTNLFALQAIGDSWANRMVELCSNMFHILNVTLYTDSGSRHDTLWEEEIRTSVDSSRDRRRLRNMEIDKFRYRRTINSLSNSLRTESVRTDCTHSKLRCYCYITDCTHSKLSCYCYMLQVSSNRYSSIIPLPNLRITQHSLRTVRSFWNEFVKLGIWWINTFGFSVSKCWSWTQRKCVTRVCVCVCVCESSYINSLHLFSSSILIPPRVETQKFTNGLQAAIFFCVLQNCYCNNCCLFVHVTSLLYISVHN
jgi:hypothetical protein